MMLESFVLYVARDRVEKHGKSFLLKPEGILDIFAEACKQIYVVQGKEIKKPEEYIQWVMNDSLFKEIGPEILFLHNNLGVKQYDNQYSLEEKRKIMQNSIRVFKIFFEDFKKSFDYKKFQDDNDEKKTANYIVENLKIKLEDDYELEKILKSMENIGMNFIINFKKQNIYPIVSDLLIDILATEYAWDVDKDLIKAIITKWSEAKEANKERGFFDFMQYTKMELIEKVKYNNLRAYLLAEYARTLDIEKKELRKFMQHILYYIVENHNNTPTLKFNIIDEIPQRPFLLEKTKFVIGGI